MKRLGFAVTLVVLAVIAWFGLVFRPWVTPGLTFPLYNAKYRDWDIQVWQRKNDSLFEPFATALFVRHTNNAVWEAFTLSHQDGFAPVILFSESNSVVEIRYKSSCVGNFDLTTGQYFRYGRSNSVFEGVAVNPKDWWQSQTNPMETGRKNE
jgi:hypothetical protein